MVQCGQLKKINKQKGMDKMDQYVLFFVKQNERFVVKLYEAEILQCIIDKIEEGYILHYIQEVE